MPDTARVFSGVSSQHCTALFAFVHENATAAGKKTLMPTSSWQKSHRNAHFRGTTINETRRCDSKLQRDMLPAKNHTVCHLLGQTAPRTSLLLAVVGISSVSGTSHWAQPSTWCPPALKSSSGKSTLVIELQHKSSCTEQSSNSHTALKGQKVHSNGHESFHHIAVSLHCFTKLIFVPSWRNSKMAKQDSGDTSQSSLFCDF